MAKPPPPGGRKSKMPFDPQRGERLKALIGSQEIEEFTRQTGIGRTSLYGYMRGTRVAGLRDFRPQPRGDKRTFASPPDGKPTLTPDRRNRRAAPL